MMTRPLRNGLLIALLVILLDQVTKWIALSGVDFAANPISVTSFFDLVLVWNRGVSFGMFNDAGAAGPWILSGLAIAVVFGLLYWLRQAETWLSVSALGLVIGGAIGNVIDRFRFGAVVDFLDFHVAGWHWPAFNVADAAICIGAGLLLLDGLLSPERQTT
ncbi:MAG: signal peptidase II [Alphaproteobacteria bacterium]|nr:signal peptidase II [Alphaproteobacteria bacterium]